MKQRVRNFSVMAGIMMAAFFFSGESDVLAASDKPAIEGNEKTMYLDGKNRISIKGEHIVSVTYVSSKNNIATISKKGLIVPKQKGKTTIRATVVYQKKPAGKKYTSKLSYSLTVLGKAGEYFTYLPKTGSKNYEIRGLTQKGMECKNLYIPSYIGGRKVTSIGWNALSENTVMRSLHLSDKIIRWWRGDKEHFPNLKKVYLGKSLKKFGNGGMFLVGCPALSEIILDSRNEEFCVEENVLFTKDKSKLLCYPAQKEGGTYVIPDEVTRIMSRAFSGCKNLKQVVFTDNLEALDSRCFADSGLTIVSMPDEIKSLGNGVFSGCDSLSEIRLSRNLPSIPNNMFKNCISLKELEIPAGVEWIDNLAFEGCTQLTNVEVASANKKFCSRDGVVYSKNGEALKFYPLGRKDSRYVVLEGVKTIKEMAFCESSMLKEVVLPEGLEVIESYAFYDCIGLMELTLPDSVHTVWSEAFKRCEKLSRITLPDSLTELAYEVFAGCTGLTEIIIPKEVSSVNARAFYGCSNLKRFLTEEENTTFTTVDGVLFSRTMQILYCYPPGKAEESYTVPDSVKRLKEGAFIQAKWLKKVSIPDTVKYVERWCFAECESLETVRLPKKIDRISDYLFWGSKSLSAVTIPSSVTEIAPSAFYECSGLVEIKIPNSVKEIKDYAFYSCEALKTVKLGTGIERIDFRAFAQCKKMRSIVVKTTKLKDGTVGKYVFAGTGAKNGKKLTVEVPTAKKAAYTKYFRKAGLSKNAVIK